MNELEAVFHRAMVRVYEDAKRETGYNAVRFVQMVSEQGGLATARQLLHPPRAVMASPRCGSGGAST